MTTKEISEATRLRAESMKKSLVVDAKTGVGTFDKDYYTTNLPDGVTEDQVKKLQRYNDEIVHGGSLAYGEVMITAGKKNADIPSRAELEIPMVGKDMLKLVFDRTYDSRAPGSSETTVGYGRVTPQFKLHAARKTGEFAIVKSTLADLAAAAFDKKK